MVDGNSTHNPILGTRKRHRIDGGVVLDKPAAHFVAKTCDLIRVDSDIEQQLFMCFSIFYVDVVAV